MDGQNTPSALGEAQKAVEIADKTVDVLHKVKSIRAFDEKWADKLGPQDPLGQAERVVDLTSKAIDTAKKVDFIDAADKRIATQLEPKDPLDQTERVIDLTDKAIDTLKKIEPLNEIGDAVGERISSIIRPKPSKIDTFCQTMPETANRLDENCGMIVDQVGGIISECIGASYEAIKKELKKNRGSKVKTGLFAGSPIVEAGTSSCIVVDKDKHMFVYLTSENVQRITRVKKNFKLIRGKTYYYYDLTFRDGTRSYIRVSKKHRDNLERCGCENVVPEIIEELPPGEE